MQELSIERDVSGGSRNVSVLRLNGNLNINTVFILESVLAECFSDKHFQIVLDLKNLKYTSSAGIGIIMNAARDARKQKGDVRLSDVHPDIRRIFDLLGFSRIIRLFDSETDAVGSF